MHNEYGLTWLDSVDVEAMSPTQVSRWTMYARYGFMELRIKEAVWRSESVYASPSWTTPHHKSPLDEINEIRRNAADSLGT